MKNMIIQLTDERRAQLREALAKNASEITISYEERGELNDAELDSVQGGAVTAYLLIDGRPGPLHIEGERHRYSVL